MFNKQRGNPLQNTLKIMYNNYKNNYVKTTLERTCTEEGESIEQTLRRLTANKEPIPQNVPPIYTPFEEGVLPDYDIRADRFDVAIEATNKFEASKQARSAEKAAEGIEEKETTTENND